MGVAQKISVEMKLWKGLCQIRSFVEKHSQTNILVVIVPNRFDLDAQPCVNYDIKFFNRKLGKHMKTFIMHLQ